MSKMRRCVFGHETTIRSIPRPNKAHKWPLPCLGKPVSLSAGKNSAVLILVDICSSKMHLYNNFGQYCIFVLDNSFRLP